MKNDVKEPKALQKAIVYFSNLDNCLAYLAKKRWPDGVVVCPTCGSTQVHFLSTRRLWQCVNKHPKRQFSIKLGTIMEDSPIGLDKWMTAIWMIVNDKNGISSYEVHRALGVTQKSAWFMMHRIRLSMQDGSTMKLGGGSGEVEADETFIGGKARNMHKHIRARKVKQGSQAHQTIAVGVLERGGNIRTQVVENRSRHTLNKIVKENVKAGAALFTDEHHGYWGLAQEYRHQVIDHAVSYVEGKIHTNSMENFWSLLKRGIHGTYVSVEPFHLFRYLDEQSFRYNNRAKRTKPVSDYQRFDLAVSQIAGKRLTYEALTGKVGATEAF